MTARKSVSSSQKVEAYNSLEYPRPVQIPPMHDDDAADTLLRRIYDSNARRASSSFVYQDMDDYDHIDAQTLHRVVEDLQFGHDLRL